jgi:uncharacterized repeat protein (TIGR03803 family)
MSRHQLFVWAVVAALMSAGPACAFAAERAAVSPAGRTPAAPACPGSLQQLRPGGGHIVAAWCGGVLGLFDYGAITDPLRTLVRATSSSAVPPAAGRFGGFPVPPPGTVPEAFFELAGISPAPFLSASLPAGDGSLIASPSIVLGGRYEVVAYVPVTSGLAIGMQGVYRSRVYVAQTPGVLRIASPLTGLMLRSPIHLYIELLRVFTPEQGSPQPLSQALASFRSTTLHHFTRKPDGQLEWGTLLLGTGGTLYGTATAGGSYGFGTSGGVQSDGYGTIFEVVPPAKGQAAYSTHVIHSFTGGFDGKFPYGALIADKLGNLYGITTGSFTYQGSVFEMSPPRKAGAPWTLTPLHIFTGKGDGGSPSGDLIADPAGNLYGTTYYGGAGCNGVGCGVVFKLSPPAKGQSRWTERVLFAFDDGPFGGNPLGGLARSASGVLYGLTSLGGDPNAFAGTAFSLTPPAAGKSIWGFRLLHTFSGRSDGGSPNAAPILDAKGALYATTVLGGANFEGTAFRLAPPSGTQHAWVETVLHDFGKGTDGSVPHGTLSFDKAGALYGTCLSGGSRGLGMAFRLAPPASGQRIWGETEIAAFSGGFNGDGPNAALTFDLRGTIYGTTSGSRLDDYGTVFKITP